MIIIVLLIVTMFLWFLSNLAPGTAPYIVYAENGRRWLAFISVLLVVLWLFVPALRGGPL